MIEAQTVHVQVFHGSNAGEEDGGAAIQTGSFSEDFIASLLDSVYIHDRMIFYS